ncbi:MAG: glycosyltransferase family 2 protein [Chloroflexi bacterium]|nr:glycosyltransferase family 2 protein [Chloroflexota bacterium]
MTLSTLSRNGATPHVVADSAPLSAHLARARESAYELVIRSGADYSKPVISVIVPTRNRRDLVYQTVEALAAQDLEPGSYEIIIVDNASNDGTVEMLCEAASQHDVRIILARMRNDCGPAVARNVGVTLAAGDYVAFTDSDCVPSKKWLKSCVAAMASGAGIVQGMTLAVPGQRQPLFNHFIETARLDGSFSTSNVCYRRDAILAVGGFDDACRYWEDVDLGWRVCHLGYQPQFDPTALVHHQVMPLSGWQWVTQPRRFYNWPAKAARYPEFRRHLFLGLWAHPWHALFETFVAGLILARWRRAALLLTLPYLVAFPMRRRLTGRWPLAKAIAHFAYDCVSLGALLAGSIRFRRPVL